MLEQTYDLKPLRTLHAVSASQWLESPDAIAYWCEWDHPGETPRPLETIISAAQYFNWPKFIRPGSTCIDVGGHSGDTAIPMGLFGYDRSSGRKASVIVVEPNPVLSPVLDVNLAINAHVAHFHKSACAITRENVDSIELADHGNAGCNGGVLNADYSAGVRQRLSEIAAIKYTARGVTIETLLGECANIDPASVSFIKTDCEGYDKEILRGCRDFLSRFRPTLFVEWFDLFTPEDDEDLFRSIDEVGYVPLDPVTLEPADVAKRSNDLLCVPRGDRIR